jgi:hypothetical protein
MARRRTKRKTRRRRKETSIIDAMQAYTFASILSMGATGSGPIEFVTGKFDLGTKTTYDVGLGVGSGMQLVGAQNISMSDVIHAPTLAFETIQSNIRSNWIPMLTAGITAQVGFKLFKRLFRTQINMTNSKLIRPLGLGIKL